MRVFLIVDGTGDWQRVPVGGQMQTYQDSGVKFTFVGISGDNVIYRLRDMISKAMPNEFQYGIIVDETDIRIPA